MHFAKLIRLMTSSVLGHQVHWLVCMAFLSFSRITLLPLNTTSGSFALLESVVRHDAGIVVKLREAGAIILEKASLSE